MRVERGGRAGLGEAWCWRRRRVEDGANEAGKARQACVRHREVSREGVLRFTIPRCQWHIEIRVAGKVETPQARLETLLIEPDHNRFCLSYRAELACDRQPLKVDQVTVSVHRLEHGAAVAPGAA